MIISVYGRIGQGVESSVNLIADASFSSGLYVQSFQESNSFAWGQVKLDKNPILSKQVEKSDVMLVYDTGIDMKNAFGMLNDRPIVIFNTTEKIKNAALKKKKAKVYALDATGIGISLYNKPVPGFAMLGALAKNVTKITMKAIKSAAEKRGLKDMLAIDEGYKTVKAVKA